MPTLERSQIRDALLAHVSVELERMLGTGIRSYVSATLDPLTSQLSVRARFNNQSQDTYTTVSESLLAQVSVEDGARSIAMGLASSYRGPSLRHNPVYAASPFTGMGEMSLLGRPVASGLSQTSISGSTAIPGVKVQPAPLPKPEGPSRWERLQSDEDLC